ncbi:MAG: hypothetical protein LHV68_09690, partial [Elusimicrobia bacterium]|nr:hypothetical protein [Candidatus Liberimonas magnetica]
YNKKGDLLLNVPWGSEPVMSPNGKYLALRVAGQPTLTYFYNLNNGKYWKADKEYSIYSVSNTGQVKADTPMTDTPVTNIDLTIYIEK